MTSPQFLYHQEPVDKVDDFALANRLSYFLWRSMPDDELMRLASQNALSKPAELKKQTARLLADPRSEALSTRFVSQWLRLQDVGQEVWPEPFYYPDFSEQLAQSMVKETQLFFQHLVQEDRPLLELYDADYTYINERLARHYGIEGVSGEVRTNLEAYVGKLTAEDLQNWRETLPRLRAAARSRPFLAAGRAGAPFPHPRVKSRRW